MKYVVDTNIINKLVDGAINAGELPAVGTFVATHVQIDELRRTKNARRRKILMAKFDEIVDEILPTESFVLGVSELGGGKLGTGELYEAIKSDLDSINSSKANNSADALIAEVAAKSGFALLTADFDLYQVIQQYDIAHYYWTT